MKCVLTLSTALLAWAAPAAAQVISIRTVPVSQAHQFDLFPSTALAMGGVSIAVDDTLLDPFSNPAMGTRLGAPRFFGSPGLYSVSSGAGAGRTLPLGAVMKQGAWFGGLALALQEVDLSDRFVNTAQIPISCPACTAEGIDPGPVDQSRGNRYAFFSLGRDFESAGLSVGGSIFLSGLHAVDGVDLLYANAVRIRQEGHAVDVRLGLLKEFEGDRSLQAIVLHNQFDMTHDVFYFDTFWDPGTQQFSQRPRPEANRDRSTTWGWHLEYQQPLASEGWRIGWLATANRKSHPKIPNYEIMNIPRDPGHSSAFNVGVGISRRRGTAQTFGVDLIYEPIWSHTWSDSETPVETDRGEVIPIGGKIIENDFRFSNFQVRMGFGDELEINEKGDAIGLQLGLGLRDIHYWLTQTDNVQLTSRDQEESWTEWSPSWGLSVRFPGLEVRYRGVVTHGTGRPGVVPNNGGVMVPDFAAAPGSNILVAPSGPLTLGEVNVTTHQVSFSLPLR